MKRVKGIYENKVVKLLEPLNAAAGSEVEVLFPQLYQEAKARQFALLDQGFQMGKVTRQSRTELHER